MPATPDRLLLVTGGSGQLGRRVIDLLLDAKVGPLATTTRNPAKLANLAAQGVRVRRTSFDDRIETIADALEGAERMLLVSTDAVDRVGRRAEQHSRAIEAAKRAGVKHVLYTSIVHPEPPTPVLVSVDHWATEQALMKSGLGWTMLRNDLYAEFLLQIIPQAIARGQLVAATGEGAAAFVTREDCARVAAAALASNDSTNRAIDITGPTAVTFREVAKLVSDLTGHAVSYAPIEAAALKASLVGTGVPEPIAELLVSFHVGIAQGRLGPATSAVQELTGRPAMSVADFLKLHQNQLTARAG
jgi:NAD(P)H dehydrogenase (quinone)